MARKSKKVTGRAIRGGHAKGTPDLLVMLPRPCGSAGTLVACPIWIEVKRPGEKQTQEQLDFMVDALANSEGYLLVYDAAYLADWLRRYRAKAPPATAGKEKR